MQVEFIRLLAAKVALLAILGLLVSSLAQGADDGGDASLCLVDAEQKIFSDFYPASEPRARQNMATFGACPGSPDPNSFVAHGSNIRAGTDGHSTLYVVCHGDREGND